MPWGEAVRLAQMLVNDPASQVGTILGGYKHPWTPEWAVTADLFDRVTQLQGAKARPYPRPWSVTPDGKRRGKTDKTRAEVISILNAHGHRIGG